MRKLFFAVIEVFLAILWLLAALNSSQGRPRYWNPPRFRT